MRQHPLGERQSARLPRPAEPEHGLLVHRGTAARPCYLDEQGHAFILPLYVRAGPRTLRGGRIAGVDDPAGAGSAPLAMIIDAAVEARRYQDSPYLRMWLIQLCGGVFNAILDRIGHIENLTYHSSDDSMRSAIWESLEEIKDRRLRGISLLPKPVTTTATKKLATSKDERRGLIDNLISEVSVAAGRRITRTDIWEVAGYGDATSFERFQRNDERMPKSASEAFLRVLRMTPEKFI